ncbi:hypothetical protein XELAEV_18036868mg [Xenopus laevis]|uniref:Uncharacterized protein n=1 Tax=Xenopus laevis TaxID=8355 RepID=A0A974CBK5_XENLA|nr:hypothetical protein XELAEV_18036868mg [Xenopus laevis]
MMFTIFIPIWNVCHTDDIPGVIKTLPISFCKDRRNPYLHKVFSKWSPTKGQQSNLEVDLCLSVNDEALGSFVCNEAPCRRKDQLGFLLLPYVRPMLHELTYGEPALWRPLGIHPHFSCLYQVRNKSHENPRRLKTPVSHRYSLL